MLTTRCQSVRTYGTADLFHVFIPFVGWLGIQSARSYDRRGWAQIRYQQGENKEDLVVRAPWPACHRLRVNEEGGDLRRLELEESPATNGLASCFAVHYETYGDHSS